MASPSPSELRRRALSHVTARWDGARRARVRDALQRRLELTAGRRRRATLLLAAVAAPLLALALLWPLWQPGSTVVATGPVNPPSPVARGTEQLELGDGSKVRLLQADSRVQIRSVSDTRIEVELRQGRAAFEVSRRPDRTFEVRAGTVSVRVLGTRFEVERRGDGALVEVSEGLVGVSWSGGETRLASGERGTFPTSPDPALSATGSPGSPRPPPSLARSAAASAEPAETLSPRAQLRALAESGAYARAHRLMTEQPEAVGSSASELMLAADVARSAGHPTEALPYLRRVLREHPGSGQAPLAAFTLGRLLSSLGRAAEASEAFATVGRLAPGSALAEDALARRVEATHAVGDRITARRLAEQYLSTYPSGRRAAAMRRLGGLEPGVDASVE